MNIFMEWMRLNWGWVLSFGTFLTTLILYFWRRLKAVERGVQALLRDRMVDMYERYSEKGYAPIYAKQNFENVWKQYEALGKNGVMKQIHDSFIGLSTCSHTHEHEHEQEGEFHHEV